MTREQYLEARVYDEHEYIDIEDATIEMLNDSCSFKQVGGPFAHMSAGDVLKDYDPCAFRQEVCNYQDHMIQGGNWIEYDDNCWIPLVQKSIDYINDCIKNVDPFQVTGVEQPGWYYHDDMSMAQGPFDSAEDCYNHACP